MGPETLARLVDEHAWTLVLYARQWCAAPEDVVQEAFLKLFSLRRQPDNVVAWLFCVVRNLALTAARSARRRRRHESGLAARSDKWFQPNEGAALDADAAA